MKSVLITGSTGFLGSHITDVFYEHGYKIIATKRQASGLDNCTSFKEHVEWVNTDCEGWQRKITEWKPEIIVHAAWSGVSAKSRDSYAEQFSNLTFLFEVLQIAKEVQANKVIALGSQAEYGLFSGKISETYPINPNSAYGTVKHLSSVLTEKYCSLHKINWCWLRLFSLFGEREGVSWFIPTVIEKVLSGQNLDMTSGQQKYAYMYVRDFAAIIKKIAENENVTSGIYNISSHQLYSLKEVVDKIIKLSNYTGTKVNYGAIAYRENQPMQIQGDNRKIEKEIGVLDESGFEDNLCKTIFYYKEKCENAI